MSRPNAVVVLPYDPSLDEIVLIEQLRVGALDDENSPWLLECVAGLVEPGERLDDVARRELQEESGLMTDQLLPITHCWVSPGGTDEYVSLFCAKVDASLASGVHGVTSEHEDIKVHRFKAVDAFAMIKHGQINNAASITALLWLQLQSRQELFI